jgi:hypothetical protein
MDSVVMNTAVTGMVEIATRCDDTAAFERITVVLVTEGLAAAAHVRSTA